MINLSKPVTIVTLGPGDVLPMQPEGEDTVHRISLAQAFLHLAGCGTPNPDAPGNAD